MRLDMMEPIDQGARGQFAAIVLVWIVPSHTPPKPRQCLHFAKARWWRIEPQVVSLFKQDIRPVAQRIVFRIAAEPGIEGLHDPRLAKAAFAPEHANLWIATACLGPGEL